LFSKKSKFYKWIEQCNNESKEKEWVLFIKANRKGMYVVTEFSENLNRLNINIEPKLRFKNMKMVKII